MRLLTGKCQHLAAIVLLLAATLLPGCAHRRSSGDIVHSHALPNPGATRLGARVEAQARNHPGESGFYVLDSNLEAFQARAQLADLAEKTLDVQSYIIWGDHSGRLLAEKILNAADRGVRVRILVDDINLVWKDSWITRLDAHPNIDLRVFNPFLGTRAFALLVLWDFLEAGRLTRRMHNKLFAADNSLAIMGGRNIGDEYFATRVDRNFEDLDMIAMGPVVKELSQSFDDFWNSEWAYPLDEWKSDKEKAKDIRKARKAVETRKTEDLKSFLGEALGEGDLLAKLIDGQMVPEWAVGRVVYDHPTKVNGGNGKEIRVLPEVWALVEAAQSELIVISPYFVPGEDGVAMFRKLRQRGVRIRILTNSLGSTDAPMAQTGYERYRSALLREGIELYELKPTAMSRRLDRRWFRRHATRPQTSLHTKAFVFDRKTVFVGSMNLDHRARYLNTELGLIVESPVLSGEITKLFEESIQPQNSYRMALQTFPSTTSPKLASEPVREWPVWITQDNGREIRSSHEPNVSVCRRLQADFFHLLPLEGQL